jgi:hypothetical protein
MDEKRHWEEIYATKAPETVSWYSPHLEVSLSLIERASKTSSAAIIDVGGGESTLLDDLLLRGYKNITVLDLSQTAIDVTRKRLGHFLIFQGPDQTLDHPERLERASRARNVAEHRACHIFREFWSRECRATVGRQRDHLILAQVRFLPSFS